MSANVQIELADRIMFRPVHLPNYLVGGVVGVSVKDA